jgi:hypothetical protein
MSILKMNVTASPGEKWTLVYDQNTPDFFVEIRSGRQTKRHSIAAALKRAGSSNLRLAIVDVFK